MQRHHLLPILGVLSGCGAHPSPPATLAAGGSPQVLSSQIDALVPVVLDEALVPGAVVGVIHDHRVVYQRAFGYADVARKQPVTASTRFNVGSISKTVTAWTAMTLVETSKLELDTPIMRYLTRWRLPASPFNSDRVTLRRLLSHTAGTSRHAVLEFPSTDLPSLEQTLSSASADGGVKLLTEPGTKWDYSGGGYSIAQLAIEEVTGDRFADYARKAVLHPLGMDHSDFEPTAAVLAEAARCYDNLGQLTDCPRFVEISSAGLYTTLADLTAFAAAASTGPHGEPPGRGVLQPATIERAIARADAADLGPGHWDGLGYFTDTLPDGRRSHGHGGDNRGWIARFEIITETGDGLVVLTNGSNGDSVIQQVRCTWIEWLTGKRLDGNDCKKRGWLPVLHALQRGGGLAEARATFQRVLHDARYTFDENQLNALGYALLRRHQIDEAIGVLEMNVEAFPQAGNPRDSLGEAYLAAGKRDLAIASYRKAVELDSRSDHARKVLEELESTGH